MITLHSKNSLDVRAYEKLLDMIQLGYSIIIQFVLREGFGTWVYTWKMNDMANALVWDLLVDGEIWDDSLGEEEYCPYKQKVMADVKKGYLSHIKLCFRYRGNSRTSPVVLRKKITADFF
jgi:hypothetical protein